MKSSLIILSLLCCLLACSQQKLSRKETVTQYYNAFDASDYEKIKMLIADSITYTEGDYIMPYLKESLHEKFRWDSVFQPTYKIVELEELDSQVIATVAVSSLRFEFLKNNPLTCSHKISFEEGKIAKIEALDCIRADWVVWGQGVDSLVNWTRKYHPELDGFIHDLTMNGAINYLKAIELYNNRKDSL